MRINQTHQMLSFIVCAAVTLTILLIVVNQKSSTNAFYNASRNLYIDYSDDLNSRLISVSIMVLTVLVFSPNLKK
jgi:hypothetical protein